MGFGQSKSNEVTKCYKCKWETIATYRCMYISNGVTDARNMDPVTGLKVGDGRRAPKEIPELLPYWNGECGDEISYIACDKCITDKLKSYFTNYPNGWPEQDPKNYVSYEPIKM